MRNTRTLVSEPIHGYSGRVRSVQRGTATLGSNPTDVAISAVVLAKAWANTLGASTVGTPTTSAAYLTSATNVRTVNSTSGPAHLSWEVIEEYA